MLSVISDFGAGNPPVTQTVAAEIERALREHRRSHLQPHGLIIGLEKYRRLKEESKSRKAVFLGHYNGIAIIVDSTEPYRVAVF